jgi:hypothetical protein
MDLYKNSQIKIHKDNNFTRSLNGVNQIRSYHTNSIRPLTKKMRHIDDSSQLDFISTMDIETIEYQGLQIPIAISIAFNYSESKLFLIDKEFLLIDREKTINNL